MSSKLQPLMGLPMEVVVEVLVGNVAIQASVDSPIYKMWFRKKIPTAGQMYFIQRAEESGSCSQEQLKELQDQLPEIATTVQNLCTDKRNEWSEKDELELRGCVGGMLSEQQLGSYYFHPCIYHKGSDNFIKRIFPLSNEEEQPSSGDGTNGALLRGGLTVGQLLTGIPAVDWDFAIKHFVRGYSLDVTAHADMAGSETPLNVILSNVREKALGLPSMPRAAQDDVESFLEWYLQNFPVCLGGMVPNKEYPQGDDVLRCGWSMAVAHAAAVGVQEQNLNGGWEQVYGNVVGAGGEHYTNDVLLFALAGFLMVGDMTNAMKLVDAMFVEESSEDNAKKKSTADGPTIDVVKKYYNDKAYAVPSVYPPPAAASDDDSGMSEFITDEAALLRFRWLLSDVLLANDVIDRSHLGAAAATETAKDHHQLRVASTYDDATCIIAAMGTAPCQQ